MDIKLPVPGSAARSAEQEPRTPNTKVESGSAARMAEQNVESTAVPRQSFRGTMSIRTSVATGAKFEFARTHDGPGEALPEGYKPPLVEPVAKQGTPDAAAHRDFGSPASMETEATRDHQVPSRGSWAGRVRKLFGR
ncbi:MAG TPA: hypothetical protein VGQ12_17815 [Candidatus Angelobacter sp.]|jgi:hypothetical protein|nr:hypothetical protein [Candidatus Angelobacter sp.]